MKRKIILISFLYILIGIIIFEISNGSIFQFLFENGFEVLLKYIFVGNNDRLLNHIIIADENFYTIYFGIGLSILGFFFIYNFKKILFEKNFFIESFNLKFETLTNKELYLNIIIATALSLFLELSIVRIQSSYLHFFSFLKNISLISCFLGLGIGYAFKKRNLISLNGFFLY